MYDVSTEQAPAIPNETLEHLESVLHSPSFASSRRCQDFLRFVVGELVEGRGDAIKERTIAIEVFGKNLHFDPGNDSLVRVKAREVRKRLAEYYGSNPNVSLRIELPIGAYVPVIKSLAEQASTVCNEPTQREPTFEPISADSVEPATPAADSQKLTRRKALWMVGSSLAAFAATPAILSFRHARSGLDSLWKPIFAKREPLLIFVPLLPLNGEVGPATDRVGMGPAAVIAQAAQYLTNAHQPYHLRFGADLTYSQLREQPSLLLGGFSSQWTQREVQSLRFKMFRQHPTQPGGYIVDTQAGKEWGPVDSVNGFTDHDYGLLCRLFDANSGQIMLVAAGVTTFGTESAASYLFDERLFSTLLDKAPKDWESRNFQAVIQTSVIGTTPSTPHVVTTHFW